MKKILIIGAKGMLGQELVRVFQEDGAYNVYGWDVADMDITKPEEVEKKVLAFAPECIVNAAAYNNVDQAEKEGQSVAFEVNAHGVGHLAEAARKLDVPLVHFSTDYVFDGTKRDGYTEADVPCPLSVYGHTKHLGEQELTKRTQKHYLIRLSRLFGRSGNGGAAKKSFVDTMLALAKERNELKLIDEEWSAPTYAPDLARRVKKIVASAPYGIYHCPNAGTCTWFSFAKTIFELAGISTNLQPIPASAYKRPAPRPKFSVLLNTKLPSSRSWEEALQEYLRER